MYLTTIKRLGRTAEDMKQKVINVVHSADINARFQLRKYYTDGTEKRSPVNDDVYHSRNQAHRDLIDANFRDVELVIVQEVSANGD